MPPTLKLLSAPAVHNVGIPPRQRVLKTRALIQRFCLKPTTTLCRVRLQSTDVRPHRVSFLDAVPPSIQSVPVQNIEKTTVTKTSSGYVADSQLPVACPGCGALSHTSNPQEAGFYSRSRKAVKLYTKQRLSRYLEEPKTVDNEIAQPVLSEQVRQGGREVPKKDVIEETNMSIYSVPTCDRCHDLVYNNKGHSIAHPTVEALADSVAESPYNRNHVYHVLDAADFPMSLIPNVFKTLELAKPRSQNRRARYKFTKKPTISFIITRSDLLGRSKEVVDKMMPYFQNTLRAALGRDGANIRLGNVHLVSAKRGWWTKEIKEDIWERGGGNWMVGKVNVGKSNLFPVLFPKGSGDRAPIYAELQEERNHDEAEVKEGKDQKTLLDEDSLLPPAQLEVPFPTMPTVSSLPGTTASPIRLPFGNYKGELIDLPGLERGNLEQYIQPSHRSDLVMEFRPNVKQLVIKPGQSLLLGGGLVCITPQLDPDDRSMTMLAYPFVPIEAHVTATEKAVAAQFQQRTSGIESILADRAGDHMKSAGMLSLDTDVTKARAEPLLKAKVPLFKLPFRVYSTDVLVEGIGWVELVCQVRRLRQEQPLHVQNPTQSELPSSTTGAEVITDSPSQTDHSPIPEDGFRPFSVQSSPSRLKTRTVSEDGFPLPQVEIVSPEGKFISQRRPLGASLIWDEGGKQRRRAAAAARPRRPMKGAKKREKAARRAREASI